LKKNTKNTEPEELKGLSLKPNIDLLLEKIFAENNLKLQDKHLKQYQNSVLM